MSRLMTVIVLVVLSLSGCTSSDKPLTGREQGAIYGGIAGAGTGAVVGNQLGSTGTGAAVGGVTGAATGAMIGDSEATHEDQVAEQEEILRRQQEEIDRQDREIDDLKRQHYHNEVLRERYDVRK